MTTHNITEPKPRQSPCRHSIPRAHARDTHQWQHNTSKPAIPHVDARFRKNLRQKHISGITASSKSKPAIPDVDARFRKHPLKKHISDSKSKPAISHVDARFCKQPLKKCISCIAANSESKPAILLGRRSVTQAHAGTNSRHNVQAQEKTAHSTGSRRNYRLNGKQHVIEVLKAGPNPAAHGVGTTSPRQGRRKATASTFTHNSSPTQQEQRGRLYDNEEESHW